jgi:hypothetical protein
MSRKKAQKAQEQNLKFFFMPFAPFCGELF